MEQKGNKGKSRISTFRKKKGPEHFAPSASEIRSDVNGSYTGTPLAEAGYDDKDDLYPVQDADDL